jgi:ankyrin repeat protein
MVDDLLTIADHLFQAALRYIERGNVNGLKTLLQECSEIAQVRGAGDGRGLIHAAAETGNVDAISLLLNAGCDPNMAEGERLDEPGYAPLHYAARAGHEEAVALLLARGAIASVADYYGDTPLHGALTPKIAETLLKGGADPNAICWTRYFDEALGWHFAGSPLHGAVHDAAIIRVLVGHGAKVDGSDHITGRTALHYAAARGQVEAIGTLLESGADPNITCEVAVYGDLTLRWTPLQYAARQGHESIVRVLLAAGATPQDLEIQ